MKSDAQLERDVREEILYDARIDDPVDVAISADFGLVTLRGSVATFSQKRAAGHAAKRVAGVSDVENQLDVRIMSEHRREDAEIRGAALQRLMSDSRLAADRLDADVKDGWVTLSGDVDWLYQSDAAYEDVAPLIGVVGVTNELSIRSDNASRLDVADRIEDAFERNARIDAGNIAVRTHDGTVVLEGEVSSLAEHDAAVAAAWAGPGVLAVEDRLQIVP
jgi:osmotically-inducible protein OsmY